MNNGRDALQRSDASQEARTLVRTGYIRTLASRSTPRRKRESYIEKLLVAEWNDLLHSIVGRQQAPE
jgi:hypothetical protein